MTHKGELVLRHCRSVTLRENDPFEGSLHGVRVFANTVVEYRGNDPYRWSFTLPNAGLAMYVAQSAGGASIRMDRPDGTRWFYGRDLGEAIRTLNGPGVLRRHELEWAMKYVGQIRPRVAASGTPV